MSLKSSIQNFSDKLKSEVSSHPLIYLLLSITFVYAFWIRVYRNDQLMAFYYDQGRDALTIWKLWHEGKPFLIGPVTGLTGIFLGPFFYYLIAPFYLLGGGDPVVPAYFLAFLSLLSIIIIYYLGWQIIDRYTGLIAAVISSFSFNLILSSRWLSNPTPIIFTSMVIILSMWKIINKGSFFWYLTLALFAGISMHFESASAIFYIPIILIFLFWLWIKSKQNKEHVGPDFPNIKTLISGGLLFFATTLPQILFNFRHDNLLFNNFIKLFTGGQGFRLDFWTVLETRLRYFLDVFGSKIFPQYNYIALFYFCVSVMAILYGKEKIKNKYVLIVFAIFFIVPMVGYILFQGNYGNIYDYYLTGYFYPFALLFSLGLGILWRNSFGKVLVLLFFAGFLYRNMFLTRIYMSAGVDGPTHITLGNELHAVNWIYDDADRPEKFNTDVYVPPVIPHSYDYLLLWQGYKRCGKSICGRVEPSQSVVYIIYEVDPPHPERLNNWLGKYENTSLILKEKQFGGVTVQKRLRK